MELEDTTPADLALAALACALDELLRTLADEAVGTDRLVGFLQDFERVRNRMPLVDHRLLREADTVGLADRLGQGSLSRVLVQTLRISPAEASRRLRAADELGPKVSMLGVPLPPARPVLAAAQREGAVTPEQVQVILSGLAKVDRAGFDPDDLDEGERLLTGYAATFGVRDLQRCTERFVDHLDPDGTRPDDELNHDRRYVVLTPRRDGSWVGDLRLTGPLGAKLQALLGPLVRPRVNSATTADGRAVEAPDDRTYGQRTHDALEELCDRLLRSGQRVESGGIPATVIVTIDHESLLRRSGHATTSSGTSISTRQLLELATEAEVIPAVLNRSGAVLALGRSRRIANRSQTLALVARDGGCSFPGCDRPPEFCERHHVRAWIEDGPTDLSNLTLLCRYHHHNFAARGWDCRIDAGGIPEWVPPRHVDRARRPLVNTRILAARSHYTSAA